MKQTLFFFFFILTYGLEAQPFDGMVNFSGTGSYAQNNAAFNVLPGSGDFTLEFWFRKCSIFPSSGYLFDYRASTAGSGIDCFYLDNGAALNICFQGEGGFGTEDYFYVEDPFAGIPENEWRHLAITYDTSEETASVYVNGGFVASQDSIAFSPSTGAFVWGASDLGFSLPLTFDLDECRVSDILRYIGDSAPDAAPFAPDDHTSFLWHFDEPDGVTQFEDAIGEFLFQGAPGTASIQMIITNTLNVCPGTQIQLFAHTGFSSYAWQPGALLDNASVSAPVASVLESGWFYMTANWFDCVYADSVFVEAGEAEASVTGNFSICQGDTTYVQVCCGSSYTWEPSVGVIAGESNTPGLSPSQTTIYVVTVSNGPDCFDTDTITVNVNPLPEVTISASFDTLCAGSENWPILTAVTDSEVSYLWIPTTEMGCFNCASTAAILSESTDVSVIVTTAEGCTAQDSYGISVVDCVDVAGHEDLSFELFPNPTIDEFSIRSPLEVQTICLFASDGTMIMISGPRPAFDISECSAGLYFVSCIFENGVAVTRPLVVE
ncbi:MAG: hypothetical protein JNM00_16330 [Flavobacteriales bacterium]|nr:hypothetical protein [Flavobacteriales bacterium]